MVLLGITLTLIAIVGFVTNSMVVYSLGRLPKTRKRHFFTLNLAFMGVLSSATYGINCYYLFNGKDVIPHACEIEAFIISVLLLGSIFQLTIISIERCVVVWRPFLDKKILLSHKWIVVGSVYLLAVAIACPPLFGWSRYKKVQQQFYCTFDFAGRDPNTRSYMMFLLICGYLTPISAIAVSYLIIFIVVRRSESPNIRLSDKPLRQSNSLFDRLEELPLTLQKTVPVQKIEKNKGLSRTISSLVTLQLRLKERHREFRIAILMLIVCGSFILCWTPIAILSVLWPFFCEDMPSPELLTFGAICGKTFVVINPVIYGFSKSAFRGGIRWLFWKDSISYFRTETNSSRVRTQGMRYRTRIFVTESERMKYTS